METNQEQQNVAQEKPSPEWIASRTQLFADIKTKLNDLVKLMNEQEDSNAQSIIALVAVEGVEKKGDPSQTTTGQIGVVGGSISNMLHGMLAQMDHNETIKNLIISAAIIHLTREGVDASTLQELAVEQMPSFFSGVEVGVIAVNQKTGESVDISDGANLDKLPQGLRDTLRNLFAPKEEKDQKAEA